MIRRPRNLVAHPLMLAVYPILFLYAHNIEELRFSEIILPLGASLAGAFTLLLLLGRILKDYERAALIVTLLLVGFFFYGHVFAKGGVLDPKWVVFRPRYLLPLWLVFFGGGVYLVGRIRGNLKVITQVMNAMAVSLVALQVWSIASYEIRNDGAAMDALVASPLTPAVQLRSSVEPRPDIYYIVLDAYASATTLKEHYDYDNGAFLEFLKKRGFYVVPNGRSNYAMTRISLASSLNMQHLYGRPRSEVRVNTALDRMIRHNAIARFMKSQNYKLIHFSAGWGPTDSSPHADVNFRFGRSEFGSLLIRSTLLHPFDVHLGWNARNGILKTFETLAAMPADGAPKFVFAHMMTPHPPFLFGRDGEPPKVYDFKWSGAVWKDRKGYLDQLIFTNRKIMALVETILEKSERAPIIIIQADHGPASTFKTARFKELNDITDTMLRERMTILNAYYFPRGGTEVLYESITPVNSFCVLANYYFGANCPLQPDESYYSNYAEPLRFIRVTDRIR